MVPLKFRALRLGVAPSRVTVPEPRPLKVAESVVSYGAPKVPGAAWTKALVVSAKFGCDQDVPLVGVQTAWPVVTVAV